MAFAFPTQGNVVVKSMEASGKLLVDFARDLKKFPLNQYVQIVPVKKTSGLYLKMNLEEAGRVLYDDGRNFLWADGQPAPEGLDGTESFEYESFYTKRRAFPVLLGDLTVDMSDWNILAQHMSIKARQAMTVRTVLALQQLTATANYDATHVLDVTAVSGASGSWADSTTARQDVKRSILAGLEKIKDDTLSAVSQEDFRLVISSGLAAALIQSQEISDYIKGSPDALAQVRGELPGRNSMYGLPDRLYGVELVVEDTRKVTNKKGATRAVSPALANATPFLCSRPGGLKGVESGPNFSTCVLFAHEEMTVEQLRDVPNRRIIGRVVENYAPYIVAPASGILFTNAM